MRRYPIPDKGFEESFRTYIQAKSSFDVVSTVRDMELGLSYATFSGNQHELDAICRKGNHIHIFELKHYIASEITKEIVFTFLGKVLDFYLKESQALAGNKITMYLVTVNKSIDDRIRRLCLAYGIRLIEPSIMTRGLLEYFLRDMYSKIPATNAALRLEVEGLVEQINKLHEYDYSFSDVFKTKGDHVEIETPPPMSISPENAVALLTTLYSAFEEARGKWIAISS
jgi:hypothetical protein